ncbi:MAG: hypothetical protein WB699_10625 [Bacteroidota bacterium]
MDADIPGTRFDSWTALTKVATHYYQVVTALMDGSVFRTGGYNRMPQATDMAWLYKP